MRRIVVESYDVLYVYLMGDSRKNELYMAKSIDYFGGQISQGVTFSQRKMLFGVVVDVSNDFWF